MSDNLQIANIGWVGLGMIGTEMVKRLLAAGYSAIVFERGQGLAEVVALGAGTNSDYRTIASSSDLFVLCVFDDAQVRDVLFDQGALEALRAGSVLAIHTTGAPGLSQDIAAAAPAGVSVLDATFSGGPHDIAAGNLVVMAGGDEDALERARPALSTYAREIHAMGPVGSGQVVKLLNNLLFATNLMNASHALKLAQEQGFDTSRIAKIVSGCSGASYAMARFQAPMAIAALNERVRPYLEKDVATAMAAASTIGLDVTAFAPTADYFRPAGKN